MGVGKSVHLGKKDIFFHAQYDQQHDQNRENAHRNDPAGGDGHISQAYTDAGRGQRSQHGHGDEAAVGHISGYREKADHTVRDCRQNVKDQDDENTFAGIGNLFQIQMQLLYEKAVQPVAEGFIEQEDDNSSNSKIGILFSLGGLFMTNYFP